jgi:hypothetical protein
LHRVQVRIGFYSWVDEKNAEYNERPGEGGDGEGASPDQAGAEKPKPQPYQPTPALLLRILCCGSTNYHFWLDTFMGLFLTAAFCIACGIILGKPAGVAVEDAAHLVASNHSGSARSGTLSASK